MPVSPMRALQTVTGDPIKIYNGRCPTVSTGKMKRVWLLLRAVESAHLGTKLQSERVVITGTLGP